MNRLDVMTSTHTVLVTGAGGFIGSHLTERLLSDGYHVRALVHYRGDGRAGWLQRYSTNPHPRLEIIFGDVRDSWQMNDIVENVDTVFHLAALIGIPYSFEAPRSYVDTNVLGTQNLLEAALKAEVRAFVQTSTSEVYGSAEFTPMSEMHRLNPQSPYAASKVASDALATSYFHSFDQPIAILRPFNTFGPRQSTRAVIPTIVRQMLLANGQKVELGNLEARRDFTFVEDTVEGFIQCAEKINFSRGKVINLGSGWDSTISEIAATCASVLGYKGEVCVSKARIRPNTSEVERLLSDNSLAKELLGWVPEKSSPESFMTSLVSTIEWWKERVEKNNLGGPIGYHK